MRKNLAMVEATVAHQHERDSAASSSNDGSGNGRFLCTGHCSRVASQEAELSSRVDVATLTGGW